MVYLEDFEEFEAAARSLFASSPLRTRYLSKYRGADPAKAEPPPEKGQQQESKEKAGTGESAVKKRKKKKIKREQVILKVTDDCVCLKYRTDQMADLRKIEKFSQEFLRWAVATNLDTIDEPDVELEDAKEGAKAQKQKNKRRKG
mmetsp:Transcript_30809/g.71576  ORF Transcript_30809/g.71576 Transcript_30809/m.71576 type:complete len:145 (-) Transcript_30809:207-641(-)|eukprot:CAMPEP_0171106798 /NCGR_PEP_ID=MMETSP0766_2-20121228/65533_1 /TAXON_ID=439317 /ORGANISM="Gambierdiscus australes, Strain CAWD 149" /LENGTH=144 /DNA_ID=CAMNT_0011567981 /DNA_START=157 /DNA_END=591 /DNA_ORIENTATION=-